MSIRSTIKYWWRGPEVADNFERTEHSGWGDVSSWPRGKVAPIDDIDIFPHQGGQLNHTVFGENATVRVTEDAEWMVVTVTVGGTIVSFRVRRSSDELLPYPPWETTRPEYEPTGLAAMTEAEAARAIVAYGEEWHEGMAS